MRYQVGNAVLNDASFVVKNMKDIEKLEMDYLCQATDYQTTLELGIKHGISFAVIDNWTHDPIALFGVQPSPSREGYGWVWFVGYTSPFAKTAIKQAPKFLQVIHEKYPKLHTMLSQKNTTHTRWLLKAGFKIISQFSIGDEFFFEMERTACVHPQSPQPSLP